MSTHHRGRTHWLIDPSTGDAGKAAFASTNAVNMVEPAAEPSQESGMVEANQQSTKREEKDDEDVDTSTTSEDDDGLNSEGMFVYKTTLDHLSSGTKTFYFLA